MTREFKGWHLAAMLIAFFGVIIAVNATMAVVASRSWTGLVAKNGYVASQDYNEKLAAADAQARLGWRSEISYGDGVLTVTLRDSDAAPMRFDFLDARLERPVSETADRTVELRYLGEGAYRGEADLPGGAWNLILTGELADTPYRREARLVVSEDGEGRIE